MTANRPILRLAAAREADELQVVGAGPAGLAAAITLARGGRRVIVHEAQSEVGYRFKRDVQGLENWSTRTDALDWLRSLGISTSFAALPCRAGLAFDAWNRRYPLRGREPLFYMVERGQGAGSLDRALLSQAIAEGVELRFGSRVEHLDGPGILCTGPKRADTIATGYHFDTDGPDGFWLILDDGLAPKGYAYLLVMGGRGNVKSCMFADFKREREFVERTVERFRSLVPLRTRNERFHGGVGNFRLPASAVSGTHPVAGEQAGFQDALAGFGMRYAILSGVLAARALLWDLPYDRLWSERIAPAMESSVLNRALYGAMGNRGYCWLLRAQAMSGDTRRFLRFLYQPSGFARRLLLPWVRRGGCRPSQSCNHRGMGREFGLP